MTETLLFLIAWWLQDRWGAKGIPFGGSKVVAVHEVSWVEQRVRRSMHGTGNAIFWRKAAAEDSGGACRTDGYEVGDPVSSEHDEENSAK